MFIYRIYNIDTNESYVGQTVKTLDYRLKEHIREAKRSLRGEKQDFPFFHRILLYYGVDNFAIELLEEVSDEQADEREIYWIDYYNSYYAGYNSTKGGQNRPIAELMNENANKWKMKDNTYTHSGGIGMNIKDVIAKGLYNPMGNLNGGKEVSQYDKQGNLLNTYPAASVASKETGVSVQGIRNVCNGKTKTSGGFVWKWTKDC